MEILLNRYKGDHFENNRKCDLCNKLSSVIRFRQALSDIKICGDCLATATNALNNAVLKDASKLGALK